MSTGAGAGAAKTGTADGQLFTIAALEKTRRLPYYTSSSTAGVQQQQQHQPPLRQRTAGNASTSWRYLPPECDAATNTCSNWGLTHSKTIELWQDLGPQHFPLPNISRMGSVIDTGVELRQFNVAPQLAANQSITFSRDGNEPPGGALGMVATNTHWVINLSLGDEGLRSDAAHQLYYDAMKAFCAADGIAVMAAGNGVCVGGGCKLGQSGGRSYVGVDMSDAGLQPDGVTVKPNVASYPAVMAEYFPDCVIAVANVNSAGQLVSGSNYGAAVRIAAPGTVIVSTWPVFGSGNMWQTMTLTGTSMSTPHVAGAALLLRDAFPSANNTQVVRCLISGSSQQPQFLDAGRVLGGGMLNVRAAYDCLAAEMGRAEPLFDCRTQEQVPPCVDALSGVRDDNFLQAAAAAA
ncbi:hypothetical protein OEZ86_003238 [Tetradesmus obliquus]|nr:hypothetical protein OEZ86_003238 [Tetradesmus obliquus]